MPSYVTARQNSKGPALDVGPTIQDKSRILTLPQVSCLCLPFFPEKPQARSQHCSRSVHGRGTVWHLRFFPAIFCQVLCRLACEPRHYQGDLGLRCRRVWAAQESLRALLSSGPEPVIFALLKVPRGALLFEAST